MCCASEVKSIKRAINPLIDGTEANLNFDLINAKLVLESKYDELPSKDKIIDSISKIGLTAILWKDHILQAKNATFW